MGGSMFLLVYMHLHGVCCFAEAVIWLSFALIFTAMAETEIAEVVAPEVETADIKLFGKWPCDDVQVSDISLSVRSQRNSPPTFIFQL